MTLVPLIAMVDEDLLALIEECLPAFIEWLGEMPPEVVAKGWTYHQLFLGALIRAQIEQSAS